MTEANGHANGATPSIEPAAIVAAELDQLLEGLFEPVLVEVAPGRILEVRPLMLGQADGLYGGGLAGAPLTRFLLARCVYLAGQPIGQAGADRLPMLIANRLATEAMKANGMNQAEQVEASGEASDPKA